MKTLKAQFKDEAGLYTMTFYYNAELWSVRDIVQNECSKSNSQLINILSNEK